MNLVVTNARTFALLVCLLALLGMAVACGGSSLSDKPTKGEEMSYVIGYHMTKQGVDRKTARAEVQDELKEDSATPDRQYFDAGCADAESGKKSRYEWQEVRMD